MPYSLVDPGIYEQKWRDFLNQRQVTTGRAPTPEELAAYRSAELSQVYQGEQRGQELALRKEIAEQGIRAQKEATKQAEKSGIIQAAISAPASALSIYGMGKVAGLWGAASKAPVATGPTTAAGEAARTIRSGPQALNAGAAISSGLFETAGQAALTAPQTGGILSQVGSDIGSVLGATSQSLLGSETAGAAGAETATAAAPGAFYSTTVAPILTTLGASFAGAKVAQMIPIGQGRKTRMAKGVLGGAAAGAAVGGPIGAPIGAAVGAVSSTIVCSELHRQGYLSDSIRSLDYMYGRSVDPEIYRGYLKLLTPIVCRMRKSKRFTRLIAPIGIATALEMSHRVEPKIRGTLLGKIVLAVGMPICKLVGHLIGKEIAHA